MKDRAAGQCMVFTFMSNLLAVLASGCSSFQKRSQPSSANCPATVAAVVGHMPRKHEHLCLQLRSMLHPPPHTPHPESLLAICDWVQCVNAYNTSLSCVCTRLRSAVTNPAVANTHPSCDAAPSPTFA
jgi:hypothetical protein